MPLFSRGKCACHHRLTCGRVRNEVRNVWSLPISLWTSISWATEMIVVGVMLFCNTACGKLSMVTPSPYRVARVLDALGHLRGQAGRLASTYRFLHDCRVARSKVGCTIEMRQVACTNGIIATAVRRSAVNWLTRESLFSRRVWPQDWGNWRHEADNPACLHANPLATAHHSPLQRPAARSRYFHWAGLDIRVL
jgi:hypothetical protein